MSEEKLRLLVIVVMWSCAVLLAVRGYSGLGRAAILAGVTVLASAAVWFVRWRGYLGAALCLSVAVLGGLALLR